MISMIELLVTGKLNSKHEIKKTPEPFYPTVLFELSFSQLVYLINCHWVGICILVGRLVGKASKLTNQFL